MELMKGVKSFRKKLLWLVTLLFLPFPQKFGFRDWEKPFLVILN